MLQANGPYHRPPDGPLPRDVQLNGPLEVYQMPAVVVEAVTALAAAAAGVEVHEPGTA